jgi:peptidoglycan hydrolase-like amidase
MLASLAATPLWAQLGHAQSGGTIVADLYGNRLLFDDAGRPLVPLGLMQGQRRVVLRAPGGLVVTVEGGRAELNGDTPLVVDRISGVAAKTKSLLVLETLEGKDRSQRRAAIDRWKARGFAARSVDAGGVYGVKGTVVDNRAVLVVVNDAPIPAGGGVRAVPIEWLEAMPSVSLRVSLPTSTFSSPWVRVRARDGGPVVVERVEHSIGYAEHGFEDRRYRDEIVLVPDAKGLCAVVNLVDEDVMVAGVLPSEMFATAPMQALKAQAVTARGELFAKIGRRHFTDPFLVCSEQHCQVYRGQSAEHPRTSEAARLTTGELAFHSGHVVDSVYSACCGGHSDAAEIIWDKPPRPELVGRPDAPSSTQKTAWLSPEVGAGFFVGVDGAVGASPIVAGGQGSDDAVARFLEVGREAAWCGRSTFNQKGIAWRWERSFTVDELTTLCASLGVGRVTALKVLERGPGGRVRVLRVEGSAGHALVHRELPVRRLLKNLKSGLFVVEHERSTDNAGTDTLVAVHIKGAGFGHGAGMCQQGAIGMAEAGASYTDILAHAYNGAVVRRVF